MALFYDYSYSERRYRTTPKGAEQRGWEKILNVKTSLFQEK
jgi:hypothetical protein